MYNSKKQKSKFRTFLVGFFMLLMVVAVGVGSLNIFGQPTAPAYAINFGGISYNAAAGGGDVSTYYTELRARGSNAAVDYSQNSTGTYLNWIGEDNTMAGTYILNSIKSSYPDDGDGYYFFPVNFNDSALTKRHSYKINSDGSQMSENPNNYYWWGTSIALGGELETARKMGAKISIRVVVNLKSNVITTWNNKRYRDGIRFDLNGVMEVMHNGSSGGWVDGISHTVKREVELNQSKASFGMSYRNWSDAGEETAFSRWLAIGVKVTQKANPELTLSTSTINMTYGDDATFTSTATNNIARTVSVKAGYTNVLEYSDRVRAKKSGTGYITVTTSTHYLFNSVSKEIRVNVSKRTINVSLLNASATYGILPWADVSYGFSFASSGMVYNDTWANSVKTNPGLLPPSGYNGYSDVGVYNFGLAADNGNFSDKYTYNNAGITGNLTINPAQLTIDYKAPLSKVYDGLAVSQLERGRDYTLTLNGTVLNSNNLYNGVGISIAWDMIDKINWKNNGYPIGLSVSNVGANYVVSSNNSPGGQTYNINKAPIIVQYDASAITKVYDGNIIGDFVYRYKVSNGNYATGGNTSGDNLLIPSEKLPKLLWDISANYNAGTYAIIFSNFVTPNTNYTLAWEGSAASTYTLTQKSLNAKLVNTKGEIYGGYSGIPSDYFSIVYDGFVSGDTATSSLNFVVPTISEPSGFDRLAGVGNYIFSLSNGTATNYVFGYESGSMAIAKANLNANLGNIVGKATVEYGDFVRAEDYFLISYVGFVDASQNAENIGLTPATIVLPSGFSQFSNVGSYTFSVTGGSSGNYNIVVGTTANIEVTPANLTSNLVSNVNGKTSSVAFGLYTDINNHFEINTVGFKREADVNTLTPPTIVTPTELSQFSNIGAYLIALDGGSAANYTVTLGADVNLVITEAIIDVTLSSMTKEYDGQAIGAPVYSYTLNGSVASSLYNNDTFGLTWNISDIKDYVDGGYTVIIEKTHSDNYAVKFAADYSKYIIRKKDLTAEISNNAIKYGAFRASELANLFPITLSGFVSGEGESAIAQLPIVIANGVVMYSNVGTYTVTLQGGASLNYNIIITDEATLTISQAEIIVVRDDTLGYTKAYNGEVIGAMGYHFVNPFGGNILLGGDTLGDGQVLPTITWNLDNIKDYKDGGHTIAVFSNNVEGLSIGSNNYSIAFDNTNPIGKSFVISRAQITLNYTNSLTKVYDGLSIPKLQYTYTLDGNQVEFGRLYLDDTLPTQDWNIAGGTDVVTDGYVILYSANCSNNYIIDWVTDPTLQKFVITKANLVATIEDSSLEYGKYSQDSLANYFPISYTGFVNNQTAAVISTHPTISNQSGITQLVVGGDYTFSLSGGAATNYNIDVSDTAKLAITKAKLSVTLNRKNSNSDIEYGSYTNATDYWTINSYSGFYYQDDATAVTTAPSIVSLLEMTERADVGTYEFGITGGLANNYVFEINNTYSLDITPKAISASGLSYIDQLDYDAGRTYLELYNSNTNTDKTLVGVLFSDDVYMTVQLDSYQTSPKIGDTYTKRTIVANSFVLKGDKASNYIIAKKQGTEDQDVSIISGLDGVIIYGLNLWVYANTNQQYYYSQYLPSDITVTVYKAKLINGVLTKTEEVITNFADYLVQNSAYLALDGTVNTNNYYNIGTYAIIHNNNAVKYDENVAITFRNTQESEGVVSAEIIALPITVSGVTVSKVYDGTTELADSNITNRGTVTATAGKGAPYDISGLGLTYTDISLTDKNVKTPNNIFNYTATVARDDAANFVFTKSTIYGTITPKDVVITAKSSQSKEYDGQTVSSGILFDVSDICVGDNVDNSFSGAMDLGGIQDVARSTDRTVIGIDVKIGTLVSDNYNITAVNGQYTITPKAVTANVVEGQYKIFDGRTVDSGIRYSLAGLVGSDTITVFSGALNLGSRKDVAVDASGNAIGIQVEVGSLIANNYYVDNVNGTFVINKREITVTPFSGQKSYYSTDINIQYRYSGTLTADSNILNNKELSISGTDADTYIINIGDLETGLSTNYYITLASEKYIIEAMPIGLGGITANKVYDGTADVIIDNINVDNARFEYLEGITSSKPIHSGLGFQFDLSKIIATSKDVAALNNTLKLENGAVILTFGDGLSSKNYTLAVSDYPTIYLTITKKQVKVAAKANQGKVYDGRTVTSGILYDIIGVNGATGLEDCDKNIDAAITMLLDINNVKDVTRDISNAVIGTGIYARNISSANYEIVLEDGKIDGSYTITPKKVGVEVIPNQNKAYDKTTVESGILYRIIGVDGGTGLVIGDDNSAISMTLHLNGATEVKRENGMVTGISVYAKDILSNNYEVVTGTDNLVNGTYTITPKKVTVTVVPNQSKEYDGTTILNNDINYIISGYSGGTGLESGDEIGTDISMSLFIKEKDVTLVAGIVAGQAVYAENIISNNYEVVVGAESVVSGLFIINQRTVTIVVESGQSKTYDNKTVDSGITFSVDRLVSGESIADNFSGSLNLAGATKVNIDGSGNVLPISVKQGTLVGEKNYKIISVVGDYTINKRKLIVVPKSGQTSIYSRQLVSTLLFDYQNADENTGLMSGDYNIYIGKLGISDTNKSTRGYLNVDEHLYVMGTLATNLGGDGKNYFFELDTTNKYIVSQLEISVTNLATYDKMYDATNSNIEINSASYVLKAIDDAMSLNAFLAFNVNAPDATSSGVNVGSQIAVTTAFSIANGTDSANNYKFIQPNNLKVNIIPREINIVLDKYLGFDIDKIIYNGVTLNMADIVFKGKDTKIAPNRTLNSVGLYGNDTIERVFGGTLALNGASAINADTYSANKGTLNIKSNNYVLANNIFAAQNDGLMVIIPRQITITPTAEQSKRYDANTSGEINYTYNNLADADTNAIFQNTLHINGMVNVGTYNIELGIFLITTNHGIERKNNYIVSLSDTVTYTIKKADIVLTNAIRTKTYDGNTAIFSGLDTNNIKVVSINDVTLNNYSLLSLKDSLVGNIHISGRVNQGTYALTPSNDLNITTVGYSGSNYTITLCQSEDNAAKITIIPLSITLRAAAGQSKIYNAKNVTSGIAFNIFNKNNSLLSDETIKRGLLGELCVDAQGAGQQDISIGTLTSHYGNFAITIDTTVKYTINKAPISLNVKSGQSKLYDGTTSLSDIQADINNGAVYNNDFEISDIVFMLSTKNAGIQNVVLGTQTDAELIANYQLSINGSATIIVTPRELTVAADANITKIFDKSDKFLLDSTMFSNIIYNNLCNGDQIEIDYVRSVATSTDWHVGTKKLVVKLKLSGLDGANYIIKDIIAWSANITPKELTVTGLQSNTKVYNSKTDDILVFGGTLVGAMSGDAVSLATFVLNDITYQGYAITSSANVGVYQDAIAKLNLRLNTYGDYFISPIVLTATIVPKKVNVEGVQAENKIFDGNTAIKLLNGRLNGIEVADLTKVNLVLDNGVANSSTAGTVQVNYVPQLTGTSASNYVIGTSNPVSATILKRKLTINSPKNITLTKEYDGTTSVANSSGIVLGDFTNLVEGYPVNVNYLVNYDTIFVSDNKTITISYYLSDSNYEAPTATILKGSILKKRYVIEDFALSILNKTYDGKDTYVLNVNGTISKAKVVGYVETISTLLTYQIFFNSKDVNTANKIIVKFSLSGATDSNNYLAPIDYEITSGVTISPKTINISYLNIGEGSLSQEYDGAVKTLNSTAVGTINQEDAGLIYKFKLNGTEILPIDVSSYTVETIAGNTNYIIANSDRERNFVITKKNAGNYVLNAKSHIYNGLPVAETLDSHYDSTIITNILFKYFSDERRTQEISRPSDVGNYYIRVILTTHPNYQEVAPLDNILEITPRPLSMIYNNYDVTYNGNVHHVIVSLDQSNILATDSIKVVSINTSNTNAGTYVIQNTIYNVSNNTINNNYYIQNDNFRYTIAKATISNLSLVGEKVRYDATNHSLVINGTLPTDGQIRVSYSGNEQRNVGIYTITARFATSSNYNEIADLTAKLEIIPKEITVAITGTQDLVYTGNFNPIGIEVYGAIGEEQYGLVDILEGAAGFANAGEYSATAILTGENANNYTIIGEQAITYTIAKATFGSVEFVNEEFIFSGKEHSLRLNKILNNQISVEYTNNSLTNVGEITATAKFSILNVGIDGNESYNYNEIPTTSATLRVLPKEVEVTFFGYEGLVYDKETKNITAAYVDVNGEPVSANITYQGGSSQIINAGTYTAVATITDTNYKIIGLDVRIFAIAKATFSPTFGDGGKLNVIYNGKPQTLAINEETIPEEIKVTYQNNGKINVGNYIVVAQFEVSANYNTINELSIMLYITPRELELVYKGSTNLVYNGREQTVAAEVKGEIFSQGETPDDIGLTLSNNSYTNAGDYILTAAITNNNYIITNPVLNFSIAKATVTGLSLESQTITFDGASHSLVLKGNLPNGIAVSYTNNNKTNVLYDEHRQVTAHQVTASFVVSSNYNSIAPITASLTINPLGVQITFDGYQNLVYNGNVHVLGAYYDNIIGVSQNASITYSDRPYNAGKYLATAKIEDGNYVISGDSTKSFEIDKLTAKITFVSKDRYIYNADRQTISYILDNVLAKDNVIATLIYNQGQGHMLNAGLYGITATINNPNYKLVKNDKEEPSTHILVEQRKLTIGVENVTITEGEFPTYRFIYGTNEDDSFLGQDNPNNALTTKPVIDRQFTTSGLYTIMPTGAYSRNYSISYTSGTILVYAKTLVKDDVTVDGSFQPRTELKVVDLGKDFIDTLPPEAIKGYNVEKMYDIQLFQEGVSVQPGNNIKIRLKIDNIVTSSGYYRILHIKDDGTTTLITDVKVVDNQYLEFETDSLSEFAILTTPNYSFVIVIVLGLAGLLLVGLLVAMLRRKY